jgi:hypothetical protein
MFQVFDDDGVKLDPVVPVGLVVRGLGDGRTLG